ncbi:hypothetical protein AHAS_Ahas09G0103600 [Arachis hypogaea]
MELPTAIAIDGYVVNVRVVDGTTLGNGDGKITTKSGAIMIEKVEFADHEPTEVRVTWPPPKPPYLNSHVVVLVSTDDASMLNKGGVIDEKVLVMREHFIPFLLELFSWF